MTKRIHCTQCKKPITTCFCKNVIPQQNKTKIIILQHSEEVGHHLNTAIMANLTFKDCEIFTGTDFSNNSLLKNAIRDAKRPLLIFPRLPNEESIQEKASSPNKCDLIVLIDGSWRNAKQIYRQTKLLQKLEKMELKLGYPRLYKIRKSEKDNFYSTFEAITYTLEIIEKDSYKSALELLKKQVELHIKCMGEKYKKYYL